MHKMTKLFTRRPQPDQAAFAHLADYCIRPAHLNDLEDLHSLATISGPGMTSLPTNRSYLKQRLAGAGSLDSGDHLLMLEHMPSGRGIGCASIREKAGLGTAHWNFQIVSAPPNGGKPDQMNGIDFTQFDHYRKPILKKAFLVPTQSYQGDSELGSLFLHPDHRSQKGIGRLLSLSRFMVIAASPDLFSNVIWSELRGQVTRDAHSAFYDAVMGPLLGISFRRADQRYALEGHKDLITKLPQSAIQIKQLPPSAQSVIGRVHDRGEGAKALLKAAGLAFEGVIDLFEAGPLMAAQKSSLPIVKFAQNQDMFDLSPRTWMVFKPTKKSFSIYIIYGKRPLNQLHAPFFF